MKNVIKIFLLLYIPFLISACTNSIGRAGLYHNNFSDYGVYLEEVVVDGRIIGYSKDKSYSTCGDNTGGTKLSSVSVPLEKVNVTWYAVEKKRTFRAEIDLPETNIQEKLLLNPPWTDIKKKNPNGVLIIEFRQGRKVRIKYATSVYHKSQKEVMIIGEGIGYETKEVVTKYLDIKEGDYYHYDCKKRRKELMEVGFYSGWPLVDYDQWYPGPPKNGMNKRGIDSESK